MSSSFCHIVCQPWMMPSPFTLSDYISVYQDVGHSVNSLKKYIFMLHNCRPYLSSLKEKGKCNTNLPLKVWQSLTEVRFTEIVEGNVGYLQGLWSTRREWPLSRTSSLLFKNWGRRDFSWHRLSTKRKRWVKVLEMRRLKSHRENEWTIYQSLWMKEIWHKRPGGKVKIIRECYTRGGKH